MSELAFTVAGDTFDVPNTVTARCIPILNMLDPLLKQLAVKRGGAKLVFPGEDGKPRSKPGVQFPFEQVAKRAGLPAALRFHDLRHTFASWVLDGGDIIRLSKILGDANVTITQKVYAHLAPEAWEQDYHRVSFVVPTPSVSRNDKEEEAARDDN